MADASVRRRRRAKGGGGICPFCKNEVQHKWPCQDCGFTICQTCMTDNFEIFSCNGITWECPECGRSNSF